MANQKNQHFVPKVYLRQFSVEFDRRSVCVWLPGEGRIFEGASIKGQCSKPYFYGKDRIIENLYRHPETVYAKTIDNINRNQPIRSVDFEAILFFWLVQNQRSEKSLLEIIRSEGSLRDAVKSYKGQDPDLEEFFGPKLGPKEAAQFALSEAKTKFEVLRGLRCVMIKNNTDFEFFTSDNPATFSNKLYFNKFKFSKNYGIGNSGLYVFLPISPKLGFLAFDNFVYKVPKMQGEYLNLSRKDAISLNMLTYLNHHKCIYSNNYETLDLARCMFENENIQKIEDIIKTHLAVIDFERSMNGKTVFISATPEDFVKSRRGLIHTERKPIRFTNHPRFLKYSVRPKYKDTRSEAGLIRPDLEV